MHQHLNTLAINVLFVLVENLILIFRILEFLNSEFLRNCLFVLFFWNIDFNTVKEKSEQPSTSITCPFWFRSLDLSNCIAASMQSYSSFSVNISIAVHSYFRSMQSHCIILCLICFRNALQSYYQSRIFQ